MFKKNSMKLSQDKCHLLVSGFKDESFWAKIGEKKFGRVKSKN